MEPYVDSNLRVYKQSHGPRFKVDVIYIVTRILNHFLHVVVLLGEIDSRFMYFYFQIYHKILIIGNTYESVQY